jgi:hypothetical protein
MVELHVDLAGTFEELGGDDEVHVAVVRVGVVLDVQTALGGEVGGEVLGRGRYGLECVWGCRSMGWICVGGTGVFVVLVVILLWLFIEFPFRGNA